MEAPVSEIGGPDGKAKRARRPLRASTSGRGRLPGRSSRQSANEKASFALDTANPPFGPPATT